MSWDTKYQAATRSVTGLCYRAGAALDFHSGIYDVRDLAMVSCVYLSACLPIYVMPLRPM